MGAGATGPLIQDLIATARVLRFTVRRRPPVGPVAQWLEPAAHNGLVAGSKYCPAHQPRFFPLTFLMVGQLGRQQWDNSVHPSFATIKCIAELAIFGWFASST